MRFTVIYRGFGVYKVEAGPHEQVIIMTMLILRKTKTLRKSMMLWNMMIVLMIVSRMRLMTSKQVVRVGVVGDIPKPLASTRWSDQ